MRRPRPHSGSRLRLFCFPYAGGSTSIFHTWSSDLPAGIEVCPVQLPGRGNRLQDAPFARLPPLVRTLVEVVRPLLNMPFALFGHSMGALIGFELARQLRREGRASPRRVFVSGYRAPHMPDRNPPIHLLSDSAFLDRLRELNGTPPEVLDNAEIRQLLLPTLRADFELCETYVHELEDPLGCPIVAFGGVQDSEVSRHELAAWAHHTRAAFTLRLFAGDHFFLHSARASLLDAIGQDLAQLLGPGDGTQDPSPD